MHQKKVKVTTIVLLVIALTGLQSQETIPTAGGNTSGIGGSVSFTVGQLIYATSIGSNGSITQGVQQPIEISEITGIDGSDELIWNCSVYPNPANEILVVSIKSEIQGEYFATLYNMNGNILQVMKIEGDRTGIEIINLAPAIYYLKVTCERKEIKSFKIIKY